MGGNCFAEEWITLLRPISVECGGCAFIIHGLVHRLDGGRAEGEGDIPDSHPDDIGFGVGSLKCVDSTRNLGEQIALRQYAEVLVYREHMYVVCVLVWLKQSGRHLHLSGEYSGGRPFHQDMTRL